MSTGDLNGNLQRLLRDLKAIKNPVDVDEEGLRLGDPVAFLPLFNFILLKFSRHATRFIVRHGFELAGKTDQRFIESSFKLFRDVLNVRTVLTPAQFFEQGYAERKVLLLCDVIAACKRLHNEEVRQERLAALKTTRQEQSSSRLAAPRRTSPQIKVVRNDDIEIHQVLATQHLPNASDGAQSVYKTKKLVKTSRSPSPSPGGQPAVANRGPRAQSSPSVALSAGQGQSLELTFRPVVPPNAGPRQAPPNATAPAPPIHTWFMNPAFADGAEGVEELSHGAASGFDATGRPDSSAWWRPAAGPPEEQAAPQWQGLGVLPSGAAGQPGGAANNFGVTGGRQLFFGQQPTISATTLAPRNKLQQAMPHAHVLPTQQPQGQGTELGRRTVTQRAAHVTVSDVPAAAAAAAATVVQLPGAAMAGDRRTVPARNMDEWSFSNFFGPGKVRQRRPAGGSASDDTDDSSQHGADIDAAEVPEGSDGMDGGEDLERDGSAADQDRRAAASRSPASRPYASRPAAPAQSAPAPSPNRQQQRQGAAMHSTARRHAAVAEEVDWQAKFVAHERDTNAKLEQLQEKLSATERELEKTRAEDRHSREALQALVTVLEGRVRFLECELEQCVKRAPGLERSPAGSSGQPSPRDAGTLAREPSLSWNATDRPRSAGSTAQHREPAAPTAAPSSFAAVADQLLPERFAAANPSSRSAAASYSSLGQSNAAQPAHDRPRWNATADTGTTGTRTAVPEAGHDMDGVRGTGAILSSSGGPPIASFHPYRGVSGSQAGPAVPGAGAGPVGAGSAGRLPVGMSGARVPPSLTDYRLPPAFSPMPHLSFSFQPNKLMQQVASARPGVAVAAAPSAQLPPDQQQQPLSRPLDGSAAIVDPEPAYSFRSQAHRRGSETDGSTTAALGGRTRGDAFESGVNVGAGTTYSGTGATVAASISFDAGHRRPAWGNRADDVSAATAAAPPHREPVGQIDAVAQPIAGWRGLERNVAATRADAARGSILDRAAGGRGGGANLLQRNDPPLPVAPQAAAAISVNPPSHWHGEAPAAAAATRAAYSASHVPSDAAAALGSSAQPPPPVNTGVEAGAGAAVLPAASAPGSAAAGGAVGSRSTDDVINSLYMRYTEAQDFLQTLRQR